MQFPFSLIIMCNCGWIFYSLSLLRLCSKEIITLQTRYARATGLELEKESVNLMLSKRMDPNVGSVVRLILDNARKMMEYGRDIAEITLNRTVEELSKS
jgi:hypothetical protein